MKRPQLQNIPVPLNADQKELVRAVRAALGIDEERHRNMLKHLDYSEVERRIYQKWCDSRKSNIYS